MEIIIKHFGVENDLYQECLKIRYEVLRKPLDMQILPKELEQDKQITHILLLVNGTPAGTVSLFGAKLRQMAVIQSYRGKGIGARLVEYLERLAKSRGIKEIGLDARQSAIPFYEKLGYECCSEIYEKIGIPHRNMKKLL